MEKTLKGTDFEGRNQIFNCEFVKFEMSIRSQVVNWIYESGVQARGQGNSYKFGSHQHICSRMVFKALGAINSYEERTTPLLGQGDRTKTSGWNNKNCNSNNSNYGNYHLCYLYMLAHYS